MGLGRYLLIALAVSCYPFEGNAQDGRGDRELLDAFKINFETCQENYAGANYRAAMSDCTAALAVVEELRAPELKVVVLNQIGLIAPKIGLVREGVHALEDAVRLAETLETIPVLSRAVLADNLVLAYYALGKP